MTAIPEFLDRPTTETVADLLHRLGDVPAERVRLYPPIGTVTFEQFVEINEEKPDGKIYEWVEGTLVEKAVGYYESRLTAFLIRVIGDFVESHDLGLIAAPDGLMRILPHISRGPDVSFVSWDRLPGGRPPGREDRVPSIVPDLAVEVLSEGNRPAEMARKRRDYFSAGVRSVWEIDPATRSAVVYDSAESGKPIPPNGDIDGRELLPNFRLSLRDLFDRADRAKPTV
jgi:Uma2 family endonuclease